MELVLEHGLIDWGGWAGVILGFGYWLGVGVLIDVVLCSA